MIKGAFVKKRMATVMPLCVCVCVCLNVDYKPLHSFVPFTSNGTKENTSCVLLDKTLDMGGE